MTSVHRSTGIAGAATSSGPTAVIDTFRAFTTAAVLFDQGVERLALVIDLDDARALADDLAALTCGEELGRKPPDFDLSNSPAEALTRGDLTGRTIVQRTSAGTRSVVAALDAGAAPVYAASLVVASATAEALASFEAVTIVSAGLHGTEPSEEDDLTADHIAAVLAGAEPPADIATRIADSDRAEALRRAPWAGPADVDLASTLDHYDFAMRALRTPDGHVELVREPGSEL